MGLAVPPGITACLFDLDGVVTRTATLHAAAWKETFDGLLDQEASKTGRPVSPFDAVADYDRYVDGKPRLDGTRAFLAARGIDLPEGLPEDPGGTGTVHALANRKNARFLELLHDRGVEVYPGSRRLLDEVRRAGLRTAVVSSSANTRQVLVAAGLDDAFEVRIDATVAAREHLAGKPAPDTYLAAARRLEVQPVHAAVFEDALAGIEAAVAGGFGYVVGVDRMGQARALSELGADVVVGDLIELVTD